MDFCLVYAFSTPTTMLPHHCVLLNFSISSSLSLFLSLPTYDPFPTLTSHSLLLLSLSHSCSLPTYQYNYIFLYNRLRPRSRHRSCCSSYFQLYKSVYLSFSISMCHSISLPIYQSLSLSVNLSIKNLLPQTHGLLSVLFYLPLLHYFSYICANCVDIKLLIVFFAADSIRLQYENLAHPDQWIDVSLLRTDIAWDADKKFKFKNPALGGRKLKDGDLLFLHLINFLLYKSILISWSFSKWRKIFL